ncbi:phosphotransferase [Paenirhodobacter sp.]|uniref:phosphotransferase n=1 Tax=Paenirhodobacter sp. TaxID=1965326 RepID=UPI003B422FC4
MPLNDADRGIVARDSGLPGLALALDAGALARVLGSGLLRTRYLRYKPGESCTVCLDDGGAGLILRAVTPARYDTYRQREKWVRPGSGVRFLDGPCSVVLPGTLDREIRAARLLLAPERAKPLLAGLIGPGEHRLVVLRHKPGRRIVARIETAGRPAALLKAVPPARFGALLASARMAQAQGTALLAADAELGLVVQGWVAGQTADPARAEPGDFARIGAALAALHAAPREPGEAPEPHRDALAALGRLLPDLAGMCGMLSEGLTLALRRDARPRVLCHGDFSADQVIVQPGSLRFIDWDRAGPGPAAGDLGCFLARMDADVLTGGLDPARADRLAAAFLAGYGACDPDLDLFRASALAALVCEPFRQRMEDWPEKSTALLRRAAALAGPDGALARAFDRADIEARIAAERGGPISLAAPELMRLRPGRRALIGYAWRDGTGQTTAACGKLRVRAPDRETPALHRRLLATGAVSVPPVLAELPSAHLWVQQRVAGRLLTDLLEPGGDTRPVAAAGEALARLHALPLAATQPRRNWTLHQEAAVLEKALADAATARPACGPALRAIGRALAARLAPLTEAPTTGIHRDFYPDQVIIDAGTTWLLDLDLFAAGDPMIDVGNFVAHLQEYGLRRWGTTDALEAQAAAFLRAYAQRLPVDAARFRLFRDMSLARHLWISLRIPERRPGFDALLGVMRLRSVPPTGRAASGGSPPVRRPG